MRAKKISALGAMTVAALFMSSCMTMEPEREGVLDAYTPTQFSVDHGVAEHLTEWWKAFESDQLNRLTEAAYSGSLTLEQAFARLQQAEAIARKTGAAEAFQLNAKADASTQHNSNSDGNSSVDSFSVGLYASYELDLWGRIRSSQQAANATWLASQFDFQTAAMSLAAELAQNYFTWLAQSDVLALYESQLKSGHSKLDAMGLRYRTGQATSLAVLQQRQQVAAAEAKLPPIRAQIKNLEHKIAILTGRIPGTDLGLVQEPLPALPKKPAVGLPVALLENRPDVQSARLALESADWNVGAARAARLPSLSLTGSIATGEEKIDQLFDDWISNLAASLLGPLIDGGARKAEVDRTMAVSREKIAAYRQAVLEAISETEDALSNERHQIDYVEALDRQYTAARNSETESIRRYQRGVLPYLDTLTAIVSRESLEIMHVQARADLLVDRVQLYRSLGGDWSFIKEDN